MAFLLWRWWASSKRSSDDEQTDDQSAQPHVNGPFLGGFFSWPTPGGAQKTDAHAHSTSGRRPDTESVADPLTPVVTSALTKSLEELTSRTELEVHRGEGGVYGQEMPDNTEEDCEKVVEEEDDEDEDEERPDKGKVEVLVLRCLLPALGVTSPEVGYGRELERQAREVLVCDFMCDVGRFEASFVTSAARLLSAISRPIPEGFLRLGRMDECLLAPGDFYVSVVPFMTSLDQDTGAGLALIARPHHSLEQCPCTEQEKQCSKEDNGQGEENESGLLEMVLTPDQTSDLLMSNRLPDESLEPLLTHLLVCTERAFERIPWPSTRLTRQCSRCDGQVDDIEEICDEDHHDSDAVLNSSEKLTQEATNLLPTDLRQLDIGHLQARVAAIPGCRDRTGRAVLTVDLEALDTVIKNTSEGTFAASGLAQLFLYFHSTICRREVAARGALVVVDARGTLSSGRDGLLTVVEEAFRITEATLPGAINTALVIWPSPSASCPPPRSTSICNAQQLESVRSVEELQKVVKADQLPEYLGGSYRFDSHEWVAFRELLEPFVRSCREAGQILVSSLQELRTVRLAESSSVAQTVDAVTDHKKAVAKVFEDPQVSHLQRSGQEVLGELERKQRAAPHNHDYREAVERTNTLYGEVQRAVSKLARLSDKRLHKLEQCLQLRVLEEDADQILSWLRTQGEESLRKHGALAASLGGVRAQEREFEKFYFLAMRHIEKGHDLLEEAGQLSPNPEEAPTLCELTQCLKSTLSVFCGRLEEQREKLEDTSKCYQLLDKAYEWALEAMKFVSRLKMEQRATADDLSRLLRHLQAYWVAHPPLPDQVFNEMDHLATKLGNERLREQCKVALVRCRETAELMEARQETLVKTKRQMEAEGSIRTTVSDETPSQYKEGSVTSSRRKSIAVLPASSTSWDLDHDDGHLYLRRGQEKSNFLSTPVYFLRHARRCMRRSQTWQNHGEDTIEDEDDGDLDDDDEDEGKGSWRRSSVGTVLSKNALVLGGSTESIPSLLENPGSPMANRKYPPVPANSHLMDRASTLQLQFPASSIADLRANPEKFKHHKTLLLVMREMVQTERDYVKSLEYVIENYIPEVMREDIPQALRGKRNVIFGNIEKIHEFHSRYFLAELEQREMAPFHVAQCFLRHETQFYLYALYNKNKPQSDSLMAEYGASFFKSKQLELDDKMDLASYLLKPVQRMGKYALLLKQLLKECCEKDVEYSDLKAAEEMVRFQLRHGNDLLAMDALRECDVNLKEQGRLLRQEEFLVWQGKSRKCLRQVFLFEDLVLFSKSRRDSSRKGHSSYLYKHSLKMTDIGMTEQTGESPTKFEIWFRKRKPNDTYTLQAPSAEVKRVWVLEFSKLLWKQALRNRELRMVEMSSMGIGNKPCLDIKPSEDQISDRSVNVAHITKVTRLRPAVTSTPLDYLHTTKRPHSIISVSSSSSSSSRSSSYVYGALNLAFDPSDSPNASHRSSTQHSQCSTESGIVCDISMMDHDGHKKVERSLSDSSAICTCSSLSPINLPIISASLEQEEDNVAKVQ